MFKTVKVSSRGKPDVIAVGVFNDLKIDRDTRSVHAGVAKAVARGEFTGELGNSAEWYPDGGPTNRVIVVGLGNRDSFKPDALRTVAGSLGRRMASTGQDQLAVELTHAFAKVKGFDMMRAGQAFGEGLGLIGWTHDQFRGTAAKQRRPLVDLKVRASNDVFTKGLKRGLGLAESTNIARDLSQTPAIVANTTYMANQAKAMARKTGLQCRVLQGKQLETEKLTGLRVVGAASEHGPCLIRLAYTPARPKKGAKPIVLLGKTIVYDTGGLSLKVGGSMAGMKRDKDGGCAVFGAMHAIATVIKPNRPVIGLLACAENSVSDEAYRPDDVLTFRNGVTVEVTNTDAEGRLVLADGLCWACDKEKPECIVDVATLTGGVVVALGSVYAGCWCDDDKLRGKLEGAMEASGERWWRMPHDTGYREMMRSPIADILNSAPVRKAHPIQGAAFLSYFVKEGVPWAHLDIAGVHEADADSGPFVKGPTGWGVRLLSELVDSY